MVLSKEDIDQLVREPSVAVRGSIAEKVCDGFNEGAFSESERQLAIEIFRLLLRDTEKRIRVVLASQLKESMQVPHDIIFALAQDDAEIAKHVLEYSYVLSEEDLIAITRSTYEVTKLDAIAKRATLSRELTHELVKTNIESVIKTTLKNPGANFSPETLQHILSEFAEEQSILDVLVHHGNLPNSFAEKLFNLVSDQLKDQLTRKYRLSRRLADSATQQAKDAAMLQFMSPWMSQHELQKLVDKMHGNKRLDHSVVIRSLCIGDLRFFETSMAKLVGIPASNARILMMDTGQLGFNAFYKKSGMPEAFRDAVRVLYRLALEETEYGKYRYEDYGQRIRQRVIATGNEQVENMDYILSILGKDAENHATLH